MRSGPLFWAAITTSQKLPIKKIGLQLIQSTGEARHLLSHYFRFFLPPACGALGFEATLLVSQVTGRLLGVSCATPLLGNTFGLIAVASASLVSVQVSHYVHALSLEHCNKDQTSFPSKRGLFVGTLLGVIIFKALGGSFRNVMPSDLTQPGAWACNSVPARGARYANDAEAQLVREIYNKHGCHHCGSKKGASIADHMPPNALVQCIKNEGRKKTHKNFQFRLWKLINKLLYHRNEQIMQRFYAQCQSCMKKQSAAVRHQKTTLVYHFKHGFPEPPYFTGLFLSTLNWGNDIKSVDNRI